MGNLACKVCDGTDLVMDGEYLTCQTCGTKYTLETARNMLGAADTPGATTAQSNASDFTIRAGVLTAYNGASRDVVIPNGVIDIEPQAFSDTAITSVFIPEGVTRITEYGFGHCTSLASVTLPSTLAKIEQGAFYCCYSLASVDLPKGLKALDKNAFGYCTSLKSVEIPAGITAIPAEAFKDCESLERVVIPDTVSYIGRFAFSKCAALTEVWIPDSVTTIEMQAFYGCRSLTSVRLPAQCKGIDPSAFEYTPYQEALDAATISKRRERGVCQHCGGEFKGLISKTCSQCGKPKDY